MCSKMGHLAPGCATSSLAQSLEGNLQFSLFCANWTSISKGWKGRWVQNKVIFTKRSLQIFLTAGRSRSGKRQRQNWLNLQVCVWNNFFMALLLVPAVQIPPRWIWCPCLESRKGISFSLPATSRPVLMPVLTMKLWVQNKTTCFSSLLYTGPYRE